MPLKFVWSWFDSSLLPLAVFLPLLLLLVRRVTSRSINLPPSPPRLPIIGNLHQLLSNPLAHQSLHALSKRYGPLMLLQFGQIPTLVVSSPGFAREVMKTHDAIFASRPPTKSVRMLLNGVQDLVFAPYGEFWKQLRKLCVVHLLGSKMVQASRQAREEEVAILMSELSATCSSSSDGPVDVTRILNLFANNMYCRAVLGKSYRGEGMVNTTFCELTREDVILVGLFCFEDCFPSFGWLDKFTGLERRLWRNYYRWNAVLDEVIEQHARKLREEGKREHRDFVDVLLDLENDTEAEFRVDRKLSKIIIMDMIAASTDASFIVLEWALAELIRNPKVMEELKAEVRSPANKGRSMIKEEDLHDMNYLKAVVKEVMRLHPSVPLLIPRETMEDCVVQGYDIPKGTRVIVNAWAIGRDPEAWDAPEEFRPERFLNSSEDFQGQDFKLIPFGAGRRICPGVHIAVAVLELALANLVLRFDWKLPEGMAVEDMDMNESFGLTTRKKEKLQLVVEPAVIV